MLNGQQIDEPPDSRQIPIEVNVAQVIVERKLSTADRTDAVKDRGGDRYTATRTAEIVGTHSYNPSIRIRICRGSSAAATLYCRGERPAAKDLEATEDQ